MQGKTIIGRDKQDDIYDFYETPKWATEKVVEALLDDNIICKDSCIIEPCSGAGAIVNVLSEYGFTDVKASDIQTLDCIVGDKGIDIANLPSNYCDIIITNPPYNQMTKNNMLQQFLRVAKKKVILLVNIFYLSSKARKEMLEKSHLRHVYIHSDRVTMFPYGTEKPKNGGTKLYAWLVFDKEYNSMPTLSWI